MLTNSVGLDKKLISLLCHLLLTGKIYFVLTVQCPWIAEKCNGKMQIYASAIEYTVKVLIKKAKPP